QGFLLCHFNLIFVSLLILEPSARLPAPQGVMVYSYNFRSSLRWSPVEVDGGPLLYTVHFKTAAFNQWDEMNCTRISGTECRFPQLLNERSWTVTLRVRAERGPAVSDWVQSEPFVAERNTTIGPPRVSSAAEAAFPHSLLLSITPPFAPRPGELLQYRVSYWENATRATRKELKTSSSLFKITDLKESTLYCLEVRVELQTLYCNISGLPSAPQCYSTALSEATTTGYAILIFLLILVILIFAIVGLFLIQRYHTTIKYWSQAPFRIPSHFEEYLQDPSLTFPEVLENHVQDDPCDFLSVVCSGEGSQEGPTSAEDKAPSPGSSRESE
uniref:Interferon gamma receptor 2 n=1 Tax=Nothoprocta perdicaria TaxID=30464 RepID=A0A8C6YYP7_NOTPE